MASNIKVEHSRVLCGLDITDLSVAFDGVKRMRSAGRFDDCAVSMQMFPMVSVSGSAADIVHDDARWVLSFDWRVAKDPKDARCIDYTFYSGGWPARALFFSTEAIGSDADDADGGKMPVSEEPPVTASDLPEAPFLCAIDAPVQVADDVMRAFEEAFAGAIVLE